MPRTRRQSGFTMLELLIVVAMGLVVAGFAIPTYQRAMRNYRLQGDARTINGEIQLAKMRAAANFTRARVRFFLNGTYQTELWCKAIGSPRICTAADVWTLVATSGQKRLSSQIQYGVASQTLPPPGTQTALAQPPVCRSGVTAVSPVAVPASRCIVFNSRGYPVDGGGVPYGDYGIYITDTNGAVLGTTVSRAGVNAGWRHDSQDTTAASWFRY